MKIVFSNGDSYLIERICLEADENGIPVDIMIVSNDLDLLGKIADNHGLIGFNYEEIMEPCCNEDGDYDDVPSGYYEALYGRLDSFTIEF